MILFTYPGNEALGKRIGSLLNAEHGEFELHSFPDGESYVRVRSDVRNKTVVVLCSLDDPNKKILSIYFLSRTLKNLGAVKVRLLAPYLAYMRQDKRFHTGESVTSRHFAALVSSFADDLITIDPHLHRIASLDDIYRIKCTTIHATTAIANWVRSEMKSVLLIGPDEESEQWVADVARHAGVPYTVLTKMRLGDRQVEVSIPDVELYRADHVPVLLDDIISTGRTMIETVGHLNDLGMKPAVCIGVHAIFAANSYEELCRAGIDRVVTCNSIQHESNGIDLAPGIAKALHQGC